MSCDSDPDPEGVGQFCQQHQSAVLREAIRLTGNRDLAWDLVQDTFERAVRNYSSFEPGTNGVAWLRTIMKRIFIDGCRRDRGRKGHVSIDETTLAAPPANDAQAWGGIEISEDQLRQAMARLPPKTRGLLEANVFEHQRYATLAERFGVPVSTVGTRLFRIRRKLKDLLTEDDDGTIPPPAMARAA
jgi:RNA polymerase sigma-70 factor, ECF subfamily